MRNDDTRPWCLYVKIHQRVVCRDPSYEDYLPLYSKKLHIRVRRASTSCVTSFTTFAFCLAGRVENHFANLTFP